MGRGKISESDKALGTAACMGLAVPVLFMMLMILFSKQLSKNVVYTSNFNLNNLLVEV